MFDLDFSRYTFKDKIRMNSAEVGYFKNSRYQWENKISKAFFRGANTGTGKTSDGKHPWLRLRLKHMSTLKENTPYLEAMFSKVSHQHKWVNHILKKEHQKLEKKELYEDLNYKYLIAIDGWVSGWLRGPMILKSNSVPIVVESKFKPLYFEKWIAYVHYVPVQRNLSDLIKQIEWLQQND